MTSKDTGKSTEEIGKVINILERQPDGAWRITRHIWNADHLDEASASHAATAAPNGASAGVSRTILSDGAELHFRAIGSGAPLLLLHGFMCSGRMWERFADTLGREHTLVIPDFPGHGQSGGMPEVWSHSQTAKQMFELLDQLGLKRVNAIGVSAGANTLLHMALQQPDRFDAMVLISASHRLSEESRQGLRNLPPIEQLTQFKDWNAQHNPRGESQTRALLALLRKVGDNYEDFSTPLEELAKIPARILLATGDCDRGPSLETQLELHRTLKHSTLWVVPDAGHAPFWSDFPGASAEAEKLFAGVVLNFFRDASPK